MDRVGVDLLQSDQRKILCAERGLEALSIPEDVLFAVPLLKTQVQDALAVQLADAADAGAESMDKPGQSAERSQLQNLECLVT